MNNYKKLISILREIFQIDQSDLDFGIYRVMNQKREDINDFLENQLIPQVKTIIANANLGDASAIQKELEEAVKGAKALGMNPADVPKVQTLKAQLSTTQPIELIEEEVFSHLASFFKRYYDKGDFISLRRYKKDVYAIPYEGEEVKLYWANHDQYYIKSSEYLKNYQFKIGKGRGVRFELVEASTEQNNNKAQNGKERQFRIFGDKSLEVIDNNLVIYFTYLPSEKKAKREELNNLAFDTVKKSLPSDWIADVLQKVPTAKNGDRTLLEKHINDFTARNTFDYFIHKDLGGFLRRELDFYIKNEVLHIDDINMEDTKDFSRQLTKIKALKIIGQKIITFLEQLENFQKRLWLKKKFVVETNYCITIDKIPEDYYDEIIKNEAQWEEWERLFVISELPKDLFNGGAEAERLTLLKEQEYLVLDTNFFSKDFKSRLLAEFDNLEEEMDGLLINSDNLQALNLLEQKNRAEVKLFYSDPPYNTGKDGFLYKDNYKHSSWISFIDNLQKVSIKLLSENGVCFFSIDDSEHGNLRAVLDNTMNKISFISDIAVVNNLKGRNDKDHIATANERLLVYKKPLFEENGLDLTEKQREEYNLKDENNFKYRLLGLRKRGGADTRELRENLFFPIFVNESTGRISLTKTSEFAIPIYPMKSNGVEGCWRWGKEKIQRENQLLVGVLNRNEEWRVKQIDYLFKDGGEKRVKPKSVWFGTDYSTDRATKDYKKINPNTSFKNPKPVEMIESIVQYSSFDEDLVVDFFAGSGTTGHAIINVNRKNKSSKRKYILCDVGDYFVEEMKPRIQKVIYSEDWKDGKPISRKGSSHIFKYIRLESYEDTLNNLRLVLKENSKALFKDSTFYEEYMLGYMLDTETKESLLSIKDFANPFNYHLTIIENNEPKPTVVDMVETFNYLIGLKVATIKTIDGFRVVTGIKRTGETTLIIWRNTVEKDNKALVSFFKEYITTATFYQQHIYINGDNTIANLQQEGDTWKVYLTEKVFLQKMFDTQDV